MPLTAWGDFSIQVTQGVTKQFDAEVQSDFSWPLWWNLIQLVPVLWGLALMLIAANRTRAAGLVVLSAGAAISLAWAVSLAFGQRYYPMSIADGNMYTYVLYVISLWLFAEFLGRRRWLLRFILIVILLLFLGLFGRICFQAGDLKPGLFSSVWSRNFSGAGAILFGGMVARLCILRKARRGRGHVAFFLWLFVFANVAINLGVLPGMYDRAERYYGGFRFSQFWTLWENNCSYDVVRALCMTSVLLLPMMLPLLSRIYRDRFNALFGIVPPEENPDVAGPVQSE